MTDGEGRTRRTNYMATGLLHNSPCTPCGRDTMHKNGVCMDCGVGARKPRRGRRANRMPVKQ